MKTRSFSKKCWALLCLFDLMLLVSCGCLKQGDKVAKVGGGTVDVYVVMERETAERYWNLKIDGLGTHMLEMNYYRLHFIAADWREAVLLKNQLISMGASEVSFVERDR